MSNLKSSKKSTFISISEPVFCTDSLSSTEKLLFSEILSISLVKPCTCPNSYFSKRLNVTSRHICRMMANIEEKGLLKRVFIEEIRHLIPGDFNER